MALIAQYPEYQAFLSRGVGEGSRKKGLILRLIAQLVEHCTGNTRVVGSNTVQRLNFFSGHFSSSVMAV